MKTATVLCAIAAILCLPLVALSQTSLDRATTDSILKKLTSQPRTTWISTGTIQGTHYERRDPVVTDSATIDEKTAQAVSEFEANTAKSDTLAEPEKLQVEAISFNVKHRLANTYTMTSTEVVEYDGERFRWEITMSSRTDSIKPNATLAAHLMVDAFQPDTNKHRIFTWDGQTYTTSYNFGENAIVDVDGKLPRGVHGPLTAGLIPWGSGKYSYDSLAEADITASYAFDGVKVIHLSIAHSDGSMTEVNLDPGKDYAVTSASVATTGGLEVNYTLSGYTSYDGQWVPSSVVIERKNVGEENQAPTLERWSNLRVTSTATPSLNSFAAALAPNAVVQYLTPILPSSTLYVHSGETDMDGLLTQRLAYGASQNKQRQNCATAALQHVASQFGKTVPNSAVAGLVRADGGTSLYDLKRCAQDLGMYGHVVKTDLTGLQNLGTAKAILHISGKNHFVVVDHVDNQYVWLVDLSNKTFYYPKSLAAMPLDWPEGTALLLSDRPIAGEFAGIPDVASKDIIGGATYWTCNRLAQEEDILTCQESDDMCQGLYIFFFEVWGCGMTTSGTCPTHMMTSRQYTPCVIDPVYGCTLFANWYYKISEACTP